MLPLAQLILTLYVGNSSIANLRFVTCGGISSDGPLSQFAAGSKASIFVRKAFR